MPDVIICECFARDGLQHETRFVETDRKLSVIEAARTAGFRRIEATSYSNPQRIPAFGDAEHVMQGLVRTPDVAYKNTCPNPRAVERALDDLERGRGADELSVLVSATDAHSRANLGSSRDVQWDRVAEMVRLAQGRFRLVGVVSMAFGCAFEGDVSPDTVLADVARFASLGVDAVSIGDTIGVATPRATRELFGTIIDEHADMTVIAHLHNTRGTGLVNAVAALEAGVRHFDAALGGVGGHPAGIEYGQGLTGNVCTEDLVSLFESMGVDTGIDPDALAIASRAAEEALGRPLHSMVAKAGITWRRPAHV